MRTPSRAGSMNKKNMKIYLDDEINAIEAQIENAENILNNIGDRYFLRSKEIDQKKYILNKKIEELQSKKANIEAKEEKNLSLYSEIKSLESKIIELDFKQKSTQKSDEVLKSKREKLEEIIDQLNHTLFQKNQLEFEQNSKNDLVQIVEKNILVEQEKLAIAKSEVAILEKELHAKRLEVDTWVQTSRKIADGIKRNRNNSLANENEIKEKKIFLEKALKTSEKLIAEEKHSDQKLAETTEAKLAIEKSLASIEKKNQELLAKIQTDETSVLEYKKRIKELQKNHNLTEREIHKTQIKGQKIQAQDKELEAQNSSLQLQVDKQNDMLIQMQKEIIRIEENSKTVREEIKEKKILSSQNMRKIAQQKEHLLRVQLQVQADIKILKILDEKKNILEIENKKNENEIITIEQKLKELSSAAKTKNEQFIALNHKTLEIESKKSALELALDKQKIEAEQKQPLIKKASKKSSNLYQDYISQKIDQKIIQDLCRKSPQTEKFINTLLACLEENQFYAQNLKLIDHETFFEIKIIDFFDDLKQVENVFSQLEKKTKTITGLQYGHKINHYNGKSDIQIIARPTRVSIKKQIEL